MHSAFFIYLFALNLVKAPQAIATSISTFFDSQCKESFENLDGPNGYPNGTCTELDLKGQFGSFMLVGKDPGCGVTLYSQERSAVDPCSIAAVQEIAQDTRCYNNTWIYYSIDFCDPPGSTPTIVRADNSSSNAGKNGQNSNVGAIVGGAIGGVAGAGIIAGLLLYIYRLKKMKPSETPQQMANVDGIMAKATSSRTTNPSELQSDMRYELSIGGKPPGYLEHKEEIQVGTQNQTLAAGQVSELEANLSESRTVSKK